jgi:hypothetical protein
MDMLPPKITLISPSAHHRQGDSPGDVRPDGHHVALALMAVASSSDTEKFYTLLDCVLRYDGSHTTSLRRQGDRNAFFFLIEGLLAMIPVISTVLAISPIGHVDLSIVLLLL